MRTKTVEIPILESNDGVESSDAGCSTCDCSVTMNSSILDESSGKLDHNVDLSLTSPVMEHYEKTMGMFAAAMTELQMELRDKTNECEALYETARSLSQALQESDLLLQSKTLECERLSLKMQMVTFVELNDGSDPFDYVNEDVADFDSVDMDSDEYYSIPQRPAAILDQIPPFRHFAEGFPRRSNVVKSKHEPRKGRHSKNSSDYKRFLSGENKANGSLRALYGPVCVDDCEDDDENVSDMSENSNMVVVNCNNPVCVDNDSLVPDVGHQKFTVGGKHDGGMKVMIGPSQAHFYHVILERDMAKQTNSKLTRDLRNARSKLRDLKSKLDQSMSLLEIAYDSSKGGKIKEGQKSTSIPISRKITRIQHGNDLVSESKVPEARDANVSSSVRVRALPWRRNYGIDSTHGINRDKHDHLSIAEYVSFISDEEMLSKNWNSTSAKAMDAAATAKYLNIFLTPEDDADRAGGRGKSSSSLMDV